MSKLTGYITSIEHREESGSIPNWTLALCKVGESTVRIAGFFKTIAAGETISAKGSFSFKGTQHAIFTVSEAKLYPPTQLDPLTYYISDICRISSKDASLIVSSFGRGTIEVLCRYPDKLNGISELDVHLIPDILSRWNAFNATSEIDRVAEELELNTEVIQSLAGLLPEDVDIAALLYRDPMILYRSNLASWAQAYEFGRKIKANKNTLKFQKSLLLYVLRQAVLVGDIGLSAHHIDMWCKHLNITGFQSATFTESQLVKVCGKDIIFFEDRYYLRDDLNKALAIADYFNIEKVYERISIDSIELPPSVTMTNMELADKVLLGINTHGWSVHHMGNESDIIKGLADEIRDVFNYNLTFLHSEEYKLHDWQENNAFTYQELFQDNFCEYTAESPFAETLLVVYDIFDLPSDKLLALLEACHSVPVLFIQSKPSMSPTNHAAVSMIDKKIFGQTLDENFFWKASIAVTDLPCCVATPMESIGISVKAISEQVNSDICKVVLIDGVRKENSEADLVILSGEARPYISRSEILAKGNGSKMAWVIQDPVQFEATDTSLKLKHLLNLRSSILNLTE